jgi:hypothetical protein
MSIRSTYDDSAATLKFKELYPTVYYDYLHTYELYKNKQILESMLGNSYWFGYPDNKQRVAFLFVSKKYGKWQDSDNSIIRHTNKAIKNLLRNLPESIEIHSNKLNKDNFHLPWDKTETLINGVLEQFPRHTWIVHE